MLGELSQCVCVYVRACAYASVCKAQEGPHLPALPDERRHVVVQVEVVPVEEWAQKQPPPLFGGLCLSGFNARTRRVAGCVNGAPERILPLCAWVE